MSEKNKKRHNSELNNKSYFNSPNPTRGQESIGQDEPISKRRCEQFEPSAWIQNHQENEYGKNSVLLEENNSNCSKILFAEPIDNDPNEIDSAENDLNWSEIFLTYPSSTQIDNNPNEIDRTENIDLDIDQSEVQNIVENNFFLYWEEFNVPDEEFFRLN